MAVQHPDRYFFHFFFQAEDGIRDTSVTGVQTCALPISLTISEIRRPQPAAQAFRYQEKAPGRAMSRPHRRGPGPRRYCPDCRPGAGERGAATDRKSVV